jgi:transcriptional regulator with XRE-family HTH domain
VGGVEGAGERVAQFRKARGLTQEGLALRMHRSVSWVSKVEQGKRPVENIRTLMHLAEALGVTLAELRTDAAGLAEPSRADVLRALRRALTVIRPHADPGDIAADVRALGDAWFGDGDRAGLADLAPGVVLRARADGGAAVVGAACMIAGSLARRFGEPDLQWIAGHRKLR